MRGCLAIYKLKEVAHRDIASWPRKNGDSTWVRAGMNMIPCHNLSVIIGQYPSFARTILQSNKFMYQPQRNSIFNVYNSSILC